LFDEQSRECSWGTKREPGLISFVSSSQFHEYHREQRGQFGILKWAYIVDKDIDVAHFFDSGVDTSLDLVVILSVHL